MTSEEWDNEERKRYAERRAFYTKLLCPRGINPALSTMVALKVGEAVMEECNKKGCRSKMMTVPYTVEVIDG